VRDLVEGTPSILLREVSKNIADKAGADLRTAGATVAVERASGQHDHRDEARRVAGVDGTFIWTPRHDQRPCSLSTALLHGCGPCRPGAAVHRWRPSGPAGDGDHDHGMWLDSELRPRLIRRSGCEPVCGCRHQRRARTDILRCLGEASGAG
jgi:hypothetical protein